jgi:hypothetical protein
MNASIIPRQSLSRRSSPTRLVLEHGSSALPLSRQPSSSSRQVSKASPRRWKAPRRPSPVSWINARLSPTPPLSKRDYCKRPVLRQRLPTHPMSRQPAPTHQELRTISHTRAELKLSSNFSELGRTSSTSLECPGLSPTCSVFRQPSPTRPRLLHPDVQYKISSHRKQELYLRGEDVWRPKPFYRTRRRVWFHSGFTLEEEDSTAGITDLPAKSRARGVD